MSLKYSGIGKRTSIYLFSHLFDQFSHGKHDHFGAQAFLIHRVRFTPLDHRLVMPLSTLCSFASSFAHSLQYVLPHTVFVYYRYTVSAHTFPLFVMDDVWGNRLEVILTVCLKNIKTDRLYSMIKCLCPDGNGLFYADSTHVHMHMISN